MLPEFRPKTYQSVKGNIAYYTAVIIFAIGNALIFYFKPENFCDLWQNKPLPFAVISLLVSFISWLLIFFVEIHDKLYDDFIVQWRKQFDLYYIIPKLVRPFTHKLDNNFFDNVKNYKDDFMKIYYEFVGDDEKNENRISERFIIRFYEVIVKYWITQINELFFLGLFIISFILYYFHRVWDISLNKIIYLNYFIIISFIVNFFVAKSFKKQVREKVDDEIEEIHKNFKEKLEKEINQFHDSKGMKYKSGKA